MHRGLNHIYRLVWDHVHETSVPVAEHCKSAGRRGARGAVLTGQLSVLALTVLPSTVHAFTDTVSSGIVVKGDILTSGNVQNVNDSGTTSGTVINDDATQNVNAGGIASSSVIRGGIQNISSGGSASDTQVNSGGTQNVSNGGSVSSTSLVDYGTQIVKDGGMASATIVSGGSTQHVQPGGIAGTTSIYDYGLQTVFGTASGTTVHDNGIQLVVGTASNTTVNGNGLQDVHGVVTSTTIYGNGNQFVSSGGSAMSTTLNSGGTQTVYDGGMASLTTIDGGAEQIVVDGGVTSDTMVNDGGWLFVDSGGTALAVTQNSDAVLRTSTNATVSGHNALGLFFVDEITHSASNVLLENGGRFEVNAGGLVSDTTVNDNGIQTVSSGGMAIGTLINSGGDQWVNSGLASDTTVNGGNQIVNGGTATDTWINSVGYQYVISSGFASDTTVNDGTQIIDSGGTATDTRINSGGYQYVLSGGSASDTTVNGGNMYNAGGAESRTVVNGGFWTMGMDAAGGLYEGGTASYLTINSGGMASLYTGTVTDATINGAMVVTPDTLSGATGEPTLQGNIAVNDGGQLTITPGALTENADVTVANSGAVYLDNHSPALGSYAYTLGGMILHGGSVHYDPASYSTLMVNSLEGAGTFYMNTEIARLQGDSLTVTGPANGNFNLFIADTGVSPTSDASLQMIKTGGGNAAFTLANNSHVVDVGTYEYYLSDNGNNTWSLTPTPSQSVPPQPEPVPPTTPDAPLQESGVPLVKRTITPGTAAVLSMATVDPLIFKAELDTVRSRLEQVRAFSHEINLWAQYDYNRFAVSDSAGAGYDMNLNDVTVGMDKSVAAGNGVMTAGGFFTYSNSDVSFDRGGDGSVDSYSAGAYASYLHNSGFYFDSVLKANSFDHDVNARMTSGGVGRGSYHTSGIGANLQGGEYFYLGNAYVAPYVAVTGFTGNSSDYTLSNGMKAHVDSLRSVIGETGVHMGHKFMYSGAPIEPYIKLAVAQEFINGNTVNVNNEHFTNDLSGTRREYQVGVNSRITKDVTVHADANYLHGSHVEEPWAASLGVSWSFK